MLFVRADVNLSTNFIVQATQKTSWPTAALSYSA